MRRKEIYYLKREIHRLSGLGEYSWISEKSCYAFCGSRGSLINWYKRCHLSQSKFVLKTTSLTKKHSGDVESGRGEPVPHLCLRLAGWGYISPVPPQHILILGWIQTSRLDHFLLLFLGRLQMLRAAQTHNSSSPKVASSGLPTDFQRVHLDLDLDRTFF